MFIFIFIFSCAPVNNYISEISKETNKTENLIAESNEKKKILKKNLLFENKINYEIELILPNYGNEKITSSLINSFELSLYKKKIKDVSLIVNRYLDLNDLEKTIKEKAKPGKIFIGTLSPQAARLVKNYCAEGILFFSFSSDQTLADNCVYLINFFPKDDLIALFNFFPDNSKIALLYPENFYGYHINRIIDSIVVESKSLIVNRSSYNEDLTNARKAIKELSKYEIRKKELERQKIILESKSDEISLKALKKIKKFETLGNVDFTHIILPDYSIRLLEIAPLLPFYDVDPNKVQFVGTGVWDDKVFFDEPSLQGAIFSGIEYSKRKDFFNSYEKIYKEKPIRTATIPYDLMGLISYIFDKQMKIKEVYELLNNGSLKFDGIDGKFYFTNNIIFRELNVLQIGEGEAIKLN